MNLRYYIEELVMKKTLSFLCLLVGYNALATPTSLLYECVGNDMSKLIFSHGSKGFEYIIYNNERDNFYLSGAKMNIKKEKDKIIVHGQLKDHSRFSGFEAEFPYGVLDSVKASLTFIDRYFMTRLNPPLKCRIKNVYTQY